MPTLTLDESGTALTETNGCISNVCQWEEDDDGFWMTSCGNTFVFEAGTPSDNKMKFCPYCGGHLMVED
jgi:hypothetical protein